MTSGEDAKKMVDAGALLLDVRTPAEFAERHIPGAVNIPMQEIEVRYEELGPPDTRIVLHCRSGRRSDIVVQFLKTKGYEDLHDFKALDAWPW